MTELSSCGEGLTFVTDGVRLSVASVFLFAGWRKFRDQVDTGPLSRSAGLPALFATQAFTRYVLPAVEVAIGSWLLAGLWISISLSVAAITLTMFSVVIILAASRGYVGGCGCFGAATRQPAVVVDVVRNITLALLAAVAITGATNPTCSQPLWSPNVGALVVGGVILLTGAAAYHLLARAEELLRTGRGSLGNGWR